MMFKLIRIIIIEVWYNPREGVRLLWVMIGTIFLLGLGCIGIGVHECTKKILDKHKTKG